MKRLWFAYDTVRPGASIMKMISAQAQAQYALALDGQLNFNGSR